MRLGVMQDYGEVVLPPILKTFWNLFPGIEIQMETGLTSGMTGRLGRHFDIVVAMHKAGEGDGDLLRREDTVWAGTASIDLGQLNPTPLSTVSRRLPIPKMGVGCARSRGPRMAAGLRQP